MSEVNWKLELTVKDGPKFTVQDKMEVEAYGKCDFEVDKGGTKVVALQPVAKKHTNFLLIQRTSEKPEPRPHPSQLTYTIELPPDTGGAPRHSDPMPLYDTHVLAGDGVMMLLVGDPMKLTFTNGEDRAAKVTILVGRRV